MNALYRWAMALAVAGAVMVGVELLFFFQDL